MLLLLDFEYFFCEIRFMCWTMDAQDYGRAKARRPYFPLKTFVSSTIIQLKILHHIIITISVFYSSLLYTRRSPLQPFNQEKSAKIFWYMHFVFLFLGCYCYYFSIIINKNYFVRCTTLYAKFIRASRCSLSSQGRIASIARSA